MNSVEVKRKETLMRECLDTMENNATMSKPDLIAEEKFCKEMLT